MKNQQSNTAERKWWQKPGLGIQYQIEQRPGWTWNRNYVRFNKAMSDGNGNLKFDGPFAKTSQFVELSKKAGTDYHMFEIKWHDGICYFNTKLTHWKTPVDYAGEFAELSRKAGIPFMYYYSTVFDHNPQFDPIQRLRYSTVSFIGVVKGNVYMDYLAGQLREIMEQYRPDGLWFDWYMKDKFYLPEKSTGYTIKYLRENYPQVVISFNNSSSAEARGKLDYASAEVHGLNRLRVKFASIVEFVTSLSSDGWRIANRNRREFDKPWELISPAGQNWQIVELRPDLIILARMGAMVMANGGKFLVGVGTLLSGEVVADHARQMEYIGEWYKSRKRLFTEAAALRYEGDQPPGVGGYSRQDFGAVAAKLGNDTLLHLINFTGAPGPVTLSLKGEPWLNAKKVFLEPAGREISIIKDQIALGPDQVDQIDTILRFQAS